MARLKTNVHVVDKNNDVHVFGPDDDVPAWARKAITNDDVWDEPPTAASPTKTAAEKKAAAEKAAAEKAAADKAEAEKAEAERAAAEETAAKSDGSAAGKPQPGEAFAKDTAGEQK